MGIPLFITATSHFEKSRTSGMSRHQNTREIPLEQKLNLNQVDRTFVMIVQYMVTGDKFGNTNAGTEHFYN